MYSDDRSCSFKRVAAVLPSLSYFASRFFIRIDLPDLSQVPDRPAVNLSTCSCLEAFRVKDLGDIRISSSCGFQFFNSLPQTISLFHIVITANLRLDPMWLIVPVCQLI